MGTITKKDVEHVANLARLKLTEEEKELYTEQLDSVLQYVQKLNELDTENVEPTTHVLPVKNVIREDLVRDSLPIEEVFKNTAEHKDNQFKVPNILGE